MSGSRGSPATAGARPARGGPIGRHSSDPRNDASTLDGYALAGTCSRVVVFEHANADKRATNAATAISLNLMTPPCPTREPAHVPASWTRLHHDAVLHDERHLFQGGDVLQRVAVHGDDVRAGNHDIPDPALA